MNSHGAASFAGRDARNDEVPGKVTSPCPESSANQRSTPKRPIDCGLLCWCISDNGEKPRPPSSRGPQSPSVFEVCHWGYRWVIENLLRISGQKTRVFAIFWNFKIVRKLRFRPGSEHEKLRVFTFRSSYPGRNHKSGKFEQNEKKRWIFSFFHILLWL